MEQMSLKDGEKNKNNDASKNSTDEDDEYADMADFEDDNVMVDEAAVTATSNPTKSASSNDDSSNSNILKVRTYDLSITYDKYYQTPRVWLMGYSSDDASTPLTGEEMMQDVIEDYANRTVTIENHPHLSGHHASIHPCQHGKVMKTIVRNLMREGEKKNGGGKSDSEEDKSGGSGGPSVEMYLFIFLKFVSSMIPTINYDFTMDVSASTKKC